MGRWARRGFLRGATGVLALGTGGALLPRAAAALLPTLPRHTLLLDGAAVGSVIVVSPPADGVKYNDFEVQMGLRMSKSFYAWLQAGPDGLTRRSGAFVDASGDRLEFTNALITEVGMPALALGSVEPAWISAKIRPESLRRAVGAKLRHPADPGAPRRWLPANFRLRIDGLEEACTHVEAVAPVTMRPRVRPESLAIQWEHPDRADAAAQLLALTLAEPHAAAFAAWLESSLADRPSNRAGSLAYLADDDMTELFALRFTGVRPLRLTPLPADASPLRTRVELTCDDIRFSFTPAALAG